MIYSAPCSVMFPYIECDSCPDNSQCPEDNYNSTCQCTPGFTAFVLDGNLTCIGKLIHSY